MRRNQGTGVQDRAPAGWLRLLATTDLHMHLVGHDYHADRADPTVGLSRVATLIRAARAEAEAGGGAVLLFDNGDAWQGAPLGDRVAGRPGAAHPMMRAFVHLGYDAVGLGNHDFNFGPEALDAMLGGAPFPVVATNLRVLEPGLLTRVRPFAVLEVPVGRDRAPLRVGVVSFLPPQTPRWDYDRLAGRIAVDDIVPVAQRMVPVLRRMGCEVVVALAHSGIGADGSHAGQENAIVPLAAIAGLDAVIAGHSHRAFPGPLPDRRAHVDAQAGTVHGTPVAMPGVAGSHLGVIDIRLAPDGAGGWRMAGAVSALRPVAGRRPDGTARPPVAEDPALVRLVAPEHAEARAGLARPVGFSAHPLHSYFAFLAPNRALALVAAAQASALRPHLAGTFAEALPLLSATSPPRTGGRAGPHCYTDIAAGQVLRRHVADLCPFPNRLGAVVLTGAQLLDWLEMSAGLFRRIVPGSRGAALVDPEMPGHDFDVLHGLSCRFDLSVASRLAPDGLPRPGGGRRVRDVAFAGRPVAAGQRFVVALSHYRAGGGGNAAALAGAEHLALPPIAIRDAVEAALRSGAGGDPLAGGAPWRFAPMPGTWVSARTGPGAAAHLPEVAAAGIVADGADADGFVRLRVPL